MTIDLPDDLLEKVAVEALKKRRNSKALVITDILRAHYRRKGAERLPNASLQWRISPAVARQIQTLRQQAKTQWT